MLNIKKTVENQKAEFALEGRLDTLTAPELETENKRPEKDPSLTWTLRKEESIRELKNTDDIGVKIIWLADKLSNMRSFYSAWKTEGDKLWNKFNQKDPALQAWYYRAVKEAVSLLKDTDAWKEYDRLTEIVFSNVKTEN